MKIVKAQLFVTVEIQVPDDADYDHVRDIINELDYNFQDTSGDANVTDSCIDDFVTDWEDNEDDNDEDDEDEDDEDDEDEDDEEQPELSQDEKAHVSPITP